MAWLPVLIKFRDLGYLAVILLLFTWVQILEKHAARDKLAMADALRAATEKAERLSNELIIEQAAAMSATQQKVVSYVTRIRNVPTPSVVCDDERMRLGNRGVRDITSGVPEAGSRPDGGQLPPTPTGARPR